MRDRWTTSQAWEWWDAQRWIVGVNFTPSSACNQLDMWQTATFDLPTIERELGWAADLGFTTVRTYLHDLLWSESPAWLDRVDAFLTAAVECGIRPILVLFDDVWNDGAALGPQPEPYPGRHNSRWLQSPGVRALRNYDEHRDRLETYVRGVVGALRNDARVLAWDVYNEPGGAESPSGRAVDALCLPLLADVFAHELCSDSSLRRRRFVTGWVVAVLVIGACTSDGAPVGGPAGASASSAAPSGSHADSAGSEWTTYMHDPSNTRTNTDTKISAANVGQLTQSWSMSGLVGVSGTPAVVGDVVYFGDWQGNARAVRADTGVELWHTALPGGFIVAAPTVVDTAVYLASGHTLYRLNRATGAIEWQVVTNESPLSQINASPVVVDNLVLQGTASIQDAVGGKDIFRGSIGAYDTATGKEVWRFYATAGDATSGSGVGIWSSPAVDTSRGLLFVGTGNTSTEPTSPLGDSMLAIDYRTGALRWSTQFTPIDVFPNGSPMGKDADVGGSPNLWTSDGHDLVGVGDKAGVYHALDRDTGAQLWQRALTPGGFFGGVIGSAAFVDGVLVMTSNGGDPVTQQPPGVARAFALDPATGEIKWTSEDFPGMIFAPVSAVPGVAFIATDKGLMTALDTHTGRRLWSFTAPNKVGCGPAIVGHQIVWGYGFFLFGGAGDGGVISFTVPP